MDILSTDLSLQNIVRLTPQITERLIHIILLIRGSTLPFVVLNGSFGPVPERVAAVRRPASCYRVESGASRQ